MPRNVFDQASRFAAQLDPAGFLAWALHLPAERLRFRGWVDARDVPFPGNTDRTGDTVAHLEDLAAHGVPWAVAAEFQIEPDALMFGRLLGYLSGIWLARKPDPAPGSRFRLGAVVVNLTGSGDASRDMRWPDAGLATELRVAERNLATESADELLCAIEAGTRSRALLPWLPLMTGGDDAGIIQRWKAAAEVEPDFRRRAEYGGLALVFASAADRHAIWEHALKEWNMRRSVVVDGWIEEGRIEGEAKGVKKGEAAALANVIVAELESKGGPVPADLLAAIRAQPPADLGRVWVPAAFRCADLADFRARVGL